MANRFLNNITINDSYTFPNADGTADQIIKTDGSGQLSFIDQSDVVAGEADKANSVILRVKNSTLSAMTKGQVICEAVSISPPSGNLIEVALADNNGTNTMPALGILNEDLDAAGGANDEGDAIMFGKVSGINTSAFSVGDEVFVDDTPGGLTTTKPTGVKYIQKVGVVIRDDASNGTIEVFGAGRTNDVPTPLYIDHANQRLGIGAPLPSEKLEIAGNAILDASNANLKIKAGTTGAKGDIQWTFNTDSTVYASAGITYDNRATDGFLIDSGYPITLDYASSYIRFSNNGSEKMRINTSGNVGIGTDNPQEKLHVYNGSAYITPIAYAANQNDWVIRAGAYSNTSFDQGLKLKSTSGGVSYMAFETAHSGGETMVLRSGNVGIGTDNPDSKLHVSGAIQNDQFIIPNTTGSNGQVLAWPATGTTLEWADAGGGAIAGTIVANQVAYGTGADTIGGHEGLTYDGNGILSATQIDCTTNLYVAGSILHRSDHNTSINFGTDQINLYSGGLKMFSCIENTVDEVVINDDSHDINFRVGSDLHTHMFFVDAGLNRVGINQPAPAFLLDVNEDDNVLAFRVTGGGGGEPIASFVRDVGATGSQVNINAQSNFPQIQFTNTGNTFSIGGDTSGNFKISDNTAIGTNDRITIDNTGDVGIGTTSPQEKLHVQNYTTGESHQAMFKGGAVTVGDYSYISLNNGYSTEYNKEVRIAAVAELSTSNKTGFAILTSPDANGASGHERLRVTANGDVGIGTTDPAEKLAVNGSIRIPRTEEFYWTDGSVNGNPRAVIFTTDNEFGGDYNGLGFSIGANGRTAPSMYIRGTGEVGIGTTSPDAKLEVEGSDHLLQLSTTSSSGSPYMSFNQAGARRSFIQHNDSSNTFIIASEFGPIDFKTSSNGSESTRIRIDTVGDVGINTTDPSAKLHVRKAAGPLSSFNTNTLSIFETSGPGYVNIVTGATSTGELWFSDSLEGRGRVRYNHSIDELELWVSNGKKADLDGFGNLSITGLLSQNSDAVLKENVEDIDGALEKVKQLRGVEFNMIGNDRKELGVIAQEVEKVLPELVTEKEGIRSVAYGNITAVLIEAIKEQQAQIDELKNQVELLRK